MDNLLDQLIRDEGEVLHAYQDSQGWWTIGVGRLIDARKGGGISQEESRYLLNNDVNKAIEQIQQFLPWCAQLDTVRLAVLQAMAFNMGIAGLLQFKNTLELVRTGNYSEAAQAMLHSKWANQVGIRAVRLSRQMELGEWQ